MTGQLASQLRPRFALVGVLLASLVVALVASQSSRAAHAAGAATCPAAPSGWTAAPNNPILWGPQQNPGQQSQQVTCTYTKGTKTASIFVIYAIPSDPNPISDFDYGCSNSNSRPWTASGRIYIDSSTKQWGFAELNDTENQLADSDVAGFVAATQALLKSSEGLGHTCTINATKPVPTHSIFRFSFELGVFGKNGFSAIGGVSSTTDGNPEIPQGSFTTVLGANGKSSLTKVTQVHAPDIPLTVVDAKKKHTVTLRITSGVDYQVHVPEERLRVNVRVVKSNYAKCKRGATGRLTLETHQLISKTVAPAKITLTVCGGIFARGDIESKADIIGS